MRLLGFTWGIGGVVLLLLFAIYRLAPMALALEGSAMSTLHWLALTFSILGMAYAEGYKGFHLAFAPRVVVRARYLIGNPRLLHLLLAPLFCMGYIHATRKRIILSTTLSVMIVGFVLTARMLPQPWRGIVDAGVVVGLTMGVFSIAYFLIVLARRPESIKVSPDLPGYL